MYRVQQQDIDRFIDNSAERVDRLVRKRFNPPVIKIDVEGKELEVLKSAEQTI